MNTDRPALSTCQLGDVGFTFAGFGFNFLLFGALADWTKLAALESVHPLYRGQAMPSLASPLE